MSWLLAVLLVVLAVDGRSFCTGVNQGSFCSLTNDREIITCPIGLRSLCPVNFRCEDQLSSNGKNMAKCVLDQSLPAVKLCQSLSLMNSSDPAVIRISRCLNDQTVVECPGAQTYDCSTGLTCVTRGRRAYCEPTGEPVKACSLGQLNSWSCDPVNLRRMVKCSTGEKRSCPAGTLCSSVPVHSQPGVFEAGCVEWQGNMQLFCRNKPVFSSFCLPTASNGAEDLSQDEFIMCSEK
jgi:hypothetical protein